MKKLIEWFRQWFLKKTIEKEIPSNCITCDSLSLIVKMNPLGKFYACKYHGYVTEPTTTLCSEYEKSHKL
jgi:hypothetical protein